MFLTSENNRFITLSPSLKKPPPFFFFFFLCNSLSLSSPFCNHLAYLRSLLHRHRSFSDSQGYGSGCEILHLVYSVTLFELQWCCRNIESLVNGVIMELNLACSVLAQYAAVMECYKPTFI